MYLLSAVISLWSSVDIVHYAVSASMLQITCRDSIAAFIHKKDQDFYRD